MLNPKIEEAFNKQINAEMFSGYLYLSMSAYFESSNLKGMANWMRVQAQEEMSHAMRFYDFIHERGGSVAFTTLDGPKTQWDSPVSVFEDALAHERKVTAMINGLVDLAIEEKDHAANAFLQWFVTEQMEEEATADEVLGKLRLAGEHGMGRFMMDAELGKRVFNLASAESEA